MSRVRVSNAARSNPKRARRFTAGTTSPRENTTPSTKRGAFGTRVTCSTISMCATRRSAAHTTCPRPRTGCISSIMRSPPRRARRLAPARRGACRHRESAPPAVAQIGRADDAVHLQQRIVQLRTTISRWPTMRSTASPTAASALSDDDDVEDATRDGANTEQARKADDRQHPAAERRNLVALEGSHRVPGTSSTSRTATAGPRTFRRQPARGWRRRWPASTAARSRTACPARRRYRATDEPPSS